MDAARQQRTRYADCRAGRIIMDIDYRTAIVRLGFSCTLLILPFEMPSLDSFHAERRAGKTIMYIELHFTV